MKKLCWRLPLRPTIYREWCRANLQSSSAGTNSNQTNLKSCIEGRSSWDAEICSGHVQPALPASFTSKTPKMHFNWNNKNWELRWKSNSKTTRSSRSCTHSWTTDAQNKHWYVNNFDEPNVKIVHWSQYCCWCSYQGIIILQPCRTRLETCSWTSWRPSSKTVSQSIRNRWPNLMRSTNK